MKMPVTIDEANKSAFAVRVKQAFVDWINNVDDAETVFLSDIQPDIYLFPDFLKCDDFANYLKNHFEIIFENELKGWWTDKSFWPPKRNFSLFCEWFDVEPVEIVWDVIEKKSA